MPTDIFTSIPPETLQRPVLKWYKENGRHALPWRNLPQYDVAIPYGVMVSEFMLQQTQVERVVPKFTAFIHMFPTVTDLAEATPAKVITLWSGLGYNRRATMLHQAAKEIVTQYDGVVPDTLGELQNLTGIGPYTAAAILAFGYNQPVVVMDTNIARFYELLFFGYTKPSTLRLQAVAHQFVPSKMSCLWYSALMDLMSVVRKEKAPALQQAALLEELSLKPAWALPSVGTQRLVRPKQSTFKGSERYYRGRIIAYLREQEGHRATYQSLSRLMAREQMPEKYALGPLLAKLKKDKLITYREPVKPRSIIRLP